VIKLEGLLVYGGWASQAGGFLCAEEDTETMSITIADSASQDSYFGSSDNPDDNSVSSAYGMKVQVYTTAHSDADVPHDMGGSIYVDGPAISLSV
jgi:hypothetical protein